MIASLVMVAAMSQGQCGIVGHGVSHGVIGHGAVGHGRRLGFRGRRAARVGRRIGRRSARLSARAHGVGAEYGCAVAPVGCAGYSKGGSPVQKGPVQKGNGDVGGIDEIPDPPAFGRTERPAGDLIVPVQQIRTQAAIANKTDFRLVLAPSGVSETQESIAVVRGSQLIVLR